MRKAVLVGMLGVLLLGSAMGAWAGASGHYSYTLEWNERGQPAKIDLGGYKGQAIDNEDSGQDRRAQAACLPLGQAIGIPGTP